MKIETAFCVELNKSVPIHEAAAVYFTKPCAERKRWAFYCDSDECRLGKPRSNVLVKAVGYDHAPHELDRGQFNCGERVRKITPYYAVVDIKDHAELCRYITTRTTAVVVDDSSRVAVMRNREKEIFALKKIIFSAGSSTSVRADVEKFTDGEVVDEHSTNMRSARDGREKPAPGQMYGQSSCQVLQTIISEYWDKMTVAERATITLDDPHVRWDQFVVPVNHYESGQRRVYFFAGKVKAFEGGYAVICEVCDQPIGKSNFRVWVPNFQLKNLRKATVQALETAGNGQVRCFFIGDMTQDQTATGVTTWKPHILNWANHLHISL